LNVENGDIPRHRDVAEIKNDIIASGTK